jgi:hypothetical protein
MTVQRLDEGEVVFGIQNTGGRWVLDEMQESPQILGEALNLADAEIDIWTICCRNDGQWHKRGKQDGNGKES